MSGHEMKLERGGTAQLTALDGERGTIICPFASAPGSRLAMLVSGRTLRLKVHRSVRNGDTFTITGRFIDLTRNLREQLVAGLQAAQEPQESPPPDEAATTAQGG